MRRPYSLVIALFIFLAFVSCFAQQAPPAVCVGRHCNAPPITTCTSDHPGEWTGSHPTSGWVESFEAWCTKHGGTVYRDEGFGCDPGPNWCKDGGSSTTDSLANAVAKAFVYGDNRTRTAIGVGLGAAVAFDIFMSRRNAAAARASLTPAVRPAPAFASVSPAELRQRQWDKMIADLNASMKFTGSASDLKLKGTDMQSSLALKLGNGDSSASGYGICGLPGIYVGGPRADCPQSGGLQLKLSGNNSDEGGGNSVAKANPEVGGMKLKIGGPDPGSGVTTQPAGSPSTSGGNIGIPGLPGIYLNNVPPAQAASVADAIPRLPAEQQGAAETAALAAAAKNPLLTAPSDDPFVQDYQRAAKEYNDALRAQQQPTPAPALTQARPQADTQAPAAVPSQTSVLRTNVEQSAAFQQLQNAAQVDVTRTRTAEEASAAARQAFDSADPHLVFLRQRAANALAALATPSLNLGAPQSNSATAPNGVDSRVVDLSRVKEPLRQPIQVPAGPAKPARESLEACIARISDRVADSQAIPSLEDLRKRLESEKQAYARIAKTAEQEHEDKKDWVGEMRKATQDIGWNMLDTGVDGLFDSSKEGLMDTDRVLHREMMETKDEAQRVRQEMVQIRQEMASAKDPARLAELNARWSDLEKNRIQPLLESRNVQEAKWEKVLWWEDRFEEFKNARDFGLWLVDNDMPCTTGHPEDPCKNFKEKNPYSESMQRLASWSPDAINPGLDGLKQVLKFGAHLTPWGETWDTVSTTIDIGYDLTVGYLGFQRLQQINQNEAQFEKAKAMLSRRIMRTDLELDCYRNR